VTVGEAIERLRKFNPDAELHLCSDNHGHLMGDSAEVEEMYESTATYGLLRPVPTVVKTVVLDTGSCGL
jgi:hypothetical protein